MAITNEVGVCVKCGWGHEADDYSLLGFISEKEYRESLLANRIIIDGKKYCPDCAKRLNFIASLNSKSANTRIGGECESVGVSSLCKQCNGTGFIHDGQHFWGDSHSHPCECQRPTDAPTASKPSVASADRNPVINNEGE